MRKATPVRMDVIRNGSPTLSPDKYSHTYVMRGINPMAMKEKKVTAAVFTGGFFSGTISSSSFIITSSQRSLSEVMTSTILSRSSPSKPFAR